jgi:glutaredoxin
MAPVSDLPALILYSRPGCGLCDEARTLLQALLDRRAAAGLAAPPLEERDIDTDPAWQRAYFATIPVVELGERRLETVTSVAALRRLLDEGLGT